eukprot:31527-Pelagococcus_subviridis.AAC.15
MPGARTHPVNAAVVAGRSLRTLRLLLHVLDPELTAGEAELANLVRLGRIAMPASAEEGGRGGVSEK